LIGGIKLDELYEKKVKCPVCGIEFVTSKVRTSRAKVIKRDADFFTYYEGENPIKYSVFVCPECGYSAMENKFKKVSSDKKKIIKDQISSRWVKKDYSGIRTIDDSIEVYKLALYCGELTNISKLDLGNICIRIAWLNRAKENKDEEERFLKNSLELFKDAYLNEYLIDTEMNEITLGYLIGEISRRLGDKEEALKWFNTVLSNPNVGDNPLIEKMVREQWTELKES
jgi:uncharacterized protein (DUF2225 family)